MSIRIRRSIALAAAAVVIGTIAFAAPAAFAAAQPQTVTITSPKPSPAYVGTANYQVLATASSGRSITFSTNDDTICKIGANSGKLDLKGAGICVVTATQPGNQNWQPASDQQSFTVIKVQANVNFSTTPAQPVWPDDVTVNVTITAADGSTPNGTIRFYKSDGVSYVPVSDTLPVTGGTSSWDYGVLEPGSTAIQAYFVPNKTERYVGVNASAAVSVAKHPQSIVFQGAPDGRVAPGVAFDVDASGGDSGNPVVLSSATPHVCDVSQAGQVQTKNAGDCVIVGEQAGDNHYSAAEGSFTVGVGMIATKVRLSVDQGVGQSVRPNLPGSWVSFRAVIVTGDDGWAGGTVAFKVDGKAVGDKVQVEDNEADSEPVQLTPGQHVVTATFVPSDAGHYGPSAGVKTFTVRTVVVY